MPDATLSAAIKEAYASAPTDVVLLHTITLDHPAFTAPIRVVRDQQDLVATLETGGAPVTFTAFAFELDLPEVADTGVPEVVLQIDNVSREIIAAIELAQSAPAKISLSYRAYLSSDLSGPQNVPPLTLTITAIEADMFKVTARATLVDFVNRRFPNEDYTDVRFPGLVV